jgi:hypothetical protein
LVKKQTILATIILTLISSSYGNAALTVTYVDQSSDRLTAGPRSWAQDGIPDLHFHLSGLSEPAWNSKDWKVTAKGGGANGIWEWPCNGDHNWYVGGQTNSDNSEEIWISDWKGGPYTLTITDADGSSQTAMASLAIPANPVIMDENFLTMNGILDPHITFSRTSSATFVGSNGLIQTARTNRPRFDYNPKTLALNGLLLEQGSTNQQLDSNFNIFPVGFNRWYAPTAFLTFNSALAPDGSTTAATITDNSVSNTHGVHYANGAFPVGINPDIPFYAWPVGDPEVESCSMFFKAGSLGFAQLQLSENANGAGVTVDIDLHDGKLANAATIGFGSTYLGSTINAYPNGIYRVSVSGIIPDPHNLSCSPLTENFLGNVSYAGAGGDISVWGADLENNAIPTSYLYTLNRK